MLLPNSLERGADEVGPVTSLRGSVMEGHLPGMSDGQRGSTAAVCRCPTETGHMEHRGMDAVGCDG